ncbi:hypothetical protein IRB23SM22_19020 [Alkalibacterium sp. s-m-22]|uniref:F0F1-ATPase subunit Ca2+/Mg2+ transporter n=1 Tax=Alkalibacterium indicireducens TaxID=398758 RepID=A0ABP3L180_9LACT
MNKKADNKKKEKNSETLRALANFSHIGVMIAASILIGVLLGRFLDNRLGSSPWLLLVFSLLGVGAAIKYLFDMPTK